MDLPFTATLSCYPLADLFAMWRRGCPDGFERQFVLMILGHWLAAVTAERLHRERLGLASAWVVPLQGEEHLLKNTLHMLNSADPPLPPPGFLGGAEVANEPTIVTSAQTA